MRTFNAQKMLSCSTFVSNVPFAQSVERGTNNGKVVCSRLTPNRFYFLFGLLSLLSSLPTMSICSMFDRMVR